MPFNSPNQFIPQTGQKIDSQQMDANFAYHDASLGVLENSISAVLDVVCPIGSVIILPILKLPAALYGFEYKWLNGQELDQQTYLQLWTYLTSQVSPALQGVAVVPASSPVRFTLPDWTGCLPMGANVFAGLGANRINGGRSDMASIGTPGALVGSQGFSLSQNNLPTGTIVRSYTGPQQYRVESAMPATYNSTFESSAQTPAQFTPFSRVVYYAMRAK